MRRVLALLVLIVELALVAENTSAEQASGAQNKVAEFNLKLNVKGFPSMNSPEFNARNGVPER